jgi:hypothetical protein
MDSVGTSAASPGRLPDTPFDSVRSSIRGPTTSRQFRPTARVYRDVETPLSCRRERPRPERVATPVGDTGYGAARESHCGRGCGIPDSPTIADSSSGRGIPGPARESTRVAGVAYGLCDWPGTRVAGAACGSRPRHATGVRGAAYRGDANIVTPVRGAAYGGDARDRTRVAVSAYGDRSKNVTRPMGAPYGGYPPPHGGERTESEIGDRRSEVGGVEIGEVWGTTEDGRGTARRRAADAPENLVLM